MSRSALGTRLPGSAVWPAVRLVSAVALAIAGWAGCTPPASVVDSSSVVGSIVADPTVAQPPVTGTPSAESQAAGLFTLSPPCAELAAPAAATADAADGPAETAGPATPAVAALTAAFARAHQAGTLSAVAAGVLTEALRVALATGRLAADAANSLAETLERGGPEEVQRLWWFVDHHKAWTIEPLLDTWMARGFLKWRPYSPKDYEVVAGISAADQESFDFGNRLVLTIDDVIPDDRLERILTVLDRYQVRPVTFFVETTAFWDEDGEPYPRTRELLQRVLADGHELGNHSHGHPNFRGMAAEAIAATIDDAQTVLTEHLGFHYPLVYLRPPYGAMPAAAVAAPLFAERGLLRIHWTITSRDWELNFGGERQRTPQSVIDVTLAEAEQFGGGVILYHGFENSAAMFEQFVQALLAAENAAGRYRFASLGEVLADKYWCENCAPAVAGPAPIPTTPAGPHSHHAGGIHADQF